MEGGYLEIQQLFANWGIGEELGNGGLAALALTSIDAGCAVLYGDGINLSYLELPNPYFSNEPSSLTHYSLSVGGEVFAATSQSESLGVLIWQGAAVASLISDLNDGTVSSPATLSAADELLLPFVAAATCTSGFGYAYAVDGGNVMFRETDFNGVPLTTASTLVGNLGVNAQTLAKAASTEGNVLVAVGTPAEIGIYLVPCP